MVSIEETLCMQKAFHATASRLVATLLNENFLVAIQEHFPESPELLLLVPSTLFEENGPLWNNDFEALVFSVNSAALHPMYQNAIILKDKIQLKSLRYIDPKDILPGIRKVSMRLNSLYNNSVLFRPFDISRYNRIQPPILSMSEVMLIASYKMEVDKNQFNRICDELENSYKNQVEDYLEKGNLAPTLSSSLLEWEQAITEGHATHPMHRTRLPNSQVAIPKSYNLSTPFIKLLLIPKNMVQIGGDYESLVRTWLVKVLKSAEVEKVIDEKEKDYILVPFHSIQSNIIAALFPEAKEVPGVCVPFDAQMSFRTVQPQNTSDIPEYHLKLPVNMTTTSATRTITPYSIHNGPVITAILKKILKDCKTLFICGEVGSVGVALNVEKGIDVLKARNLGAIFRQNPEFHLKGERIIPCASLVEVGPDGQPHVVRVFNLSTRSSRINFLQNYSSMLFSVFLPPLIEKGFAFEAHGQNTLLRIDKERECITGFAIRDFGGIRIHRPTFEAATQISTNIIMKDSEVVFENFEDVSGVLYHTVIQCQLHRLIRSLDLHHSGLGWFIVRKQLQPYFQRAKALNIPFEETWMKRDIRYKSFMRMKLNSLYREYLYTRIPNILLYESCEQYINHGN